MSHRLTNTTLLVFVSSFAVHANATDQELDLVVIDGEKHYFVETPMTEYWIQAKRRPKFDPISSANWKGYTTSWEIRDSKLLLTSLTAHIKRKPFDAAKMLGRSLPAEATWLCGPLHAVDNVHWSVVTRYSKNARRLFFIDGVLKKSMTFDRVECCTGRVGISLGNREGFTVIEGISAGSPARKSSQLETGDIIEAFTDLDGKTITAGKMDKYMALQFIRGLDKQPLKLHVRKPASDQTTVVELKRTLLFDGELDDLIERQCK